MLFIEFLKKIYANVDNIGSGAQLRILIILIRHRQELKLV